LTFGITILLIITSIIPCVGQIIDKISNIKTADFENINDVIQTNKGENHNAPYTDDFLDQFQIIWNKGIAVGPPDLLAQSFKPSENMLTRIELLVGKIGTPTDNLSILIRSSLDGPNITSISLPPKEIPTDKDWIEFDFEDVLVNIIQTYYIIFTPWGTGMVYLWWGYYNHNFDSYTNGESWLYTNDEWSTENFAIKDWCFKTYAYHLSNPPYTPHSPSGPTVGLTCAPYSYSTNTTDPDGDDIRYGWDWNGDNTVDEWTTEFYPSGATANISHSWNTSGTYNVKVKSEDKSGAQSNFSSAKKVIIVTIDNNPPEKPDAPTGKTFCKVGISYSYSASTTDPDDDRIYYMFDWDDGKSTEWTGPYNTDQTSSMSHIWDAKGTYQIKVKAKDEHGEESEWSDPLPITMPKNIVINTPFLHFLDSNSHMLPLLNHLLESYNTKNQISLREELCLFFI
jgi:hypothetical protein